MRCRICGEEFEGKVLRRVWNQLHNKSVHPDYAIWYKMWARKFMLSGVLGVAFLILADYLSLMSGNSYLLIAINVLFIAWIEVWVIQRRRTTAKLRARWKEEHGIH